MSVNYTTYSKYKHLLSFYKSLEPSGLSIITQMTMNHIVLFHAIINKPSLETAQAYF